MVATSGVRLLRLDALRMLERDLLPRASLVTPNVPEAELLLRTAIRSAVDLRRAASELQKRYGCAVLVKGGHLQRVRQAIDVYCDGRNELLLTAPLVRGRKTHGTGCTFSAAIAAYLAKGARLEKAAERAKQFVTKAIRGSKIVQGHQVLAF
jgi:hydroxymethylpyrimidine/phosphomethylpyrimidine kinase